MMQSIRRWMLAAGLLAALSVPAHAACDTGLAERMHAKLHPKRALDHELAVCQPWRGFPGRFVVVLPIRRAAWGADATELDLDVLVVQQADNGNTERATIVSRLFEPSALSEVALRIGDIKLDTARYAIAPDVRAFGLRITLRGPSRPNFYSGETLTLYVPQGPKLAKVLDALEVAQDRGEWDTNCAGNFESVRGTLSVAGDMSNGYADLLLRQSRSLTRSTMQGEECVSLAMPSTFGTKVLRYNGTYYQTSKSDNMN